MQNQAEQAQTVVTPSPEKPKRWESQAGPIQTKKVSKMLKEIGRQNQCHTEITGIHGAPETQSSNGYWVLFGSNNRPDVALALKELGDQFNWVITRDNYQDIIKAGNEKLAVVVKNTPIKDSRITAEEHTKRENDWKEMRERQQVEQEQREAAVAAANKAAGVTVKLNSQHNGVELRFPGDPGPAVRSQLKGARFKWTYKGGGCWYHRQDPTSIAFAYRMAGEPLPKPVEVTQEQGPDHFDMQVEDNMAAACGC